MRWLKKFLMHYVLYGLLLLVLCLGIFPFVIFYTSSMFIARSLDRLASGKGYALKVDAIWTKIGVPYDYLVKVAG